MLTSFGKLCRKLRIDNNEVLFDMAEKLGVSSAFLSAIENGKKSIPKDMVEKLKDIYHFDANQTSAFLEAAQESAIQVKINLQNESQENRRLVMAFARKFDSLSEEERIKIMKILNT